MSQLHKWLPEERITRLRNLAWLMTGLFMARSVHLSHIAHKLPLEGQVVSLTNRLRRFLDNPRVNVWRSSVAFARSRYEGYNVKQEEMTKTHGPRFQAYARGRFLFFWGITLVTILFLAALALNVDPYLRGPDEWRWSYAVPGNSVHLRVPAFTLILYVVTLSILVKHITRESLPQWHAWCFLASLILVTPLIQISLLYPDAPRTMFYRTVSAGSSGVFSVGSTIEDAGDFLRRYPTLMPTFPVHPQRYPPALPLLFYLARRVLEKVPVLADGLGFRLRLYQCHNLTLMRLSNVTISTAIVQMALPLVSGFTLLPLYGLALRTYGRRSATWAVALYPLVPSFALWSGRWEQFYPLLACTVWYFFHVGLTKRRRSAMLAAGFTLSVASLLNFSLLALLVPMGCFTLLWFLAQPSARLSVLKPAICGFFAFLVGLASLWIIYQVAFGTGFLDIWRVSMSYHLGLNRSYWTWLGYHLYDFFVFLGLPLAFSFLVAQIKGIREVRCQRYDTLSLGFGLGLVLLDLSGTSRGEVARVWLFLTPFAVLVAVRALTRMRLRQWSFAVVVCLMALQLFTFNTFLRVVTTGLTDPPVRTRIFRIPPISHPLSARFRVADNADSIALLGYDLEPDAPAPGDTLHLILYWQALQQMSQPYTVFTHLVGPDGRLIGQQDNMPLHNTVPTTCWVPGEVIADPYDISVSPHAPAGNYVLGTGIYHWETGERLAATGPTATPNHWVSLTQVVVLEKASVP